MPKKIKSGPNKGKYSVDFRPAGVGGKRCRGNFNTLAEANSYKQHCIKKFGNAKDWHESKPDQRTLSTLINTWYNLHGQNLKSGEARKTYLHNLSLEMNNPISSKITAATYSKFREQRLKTVGANTANHDLAYFKSLFNELIRLGEWNAPNPVGNIRRLKAPKTQLSYLSQEEQKLLLDELDKAKGSHASITARICLATGARWGEAATLTKKQVKNGMVTFTDTKNGNNRTLPLPPELYKQVKDNVPLVDGYSCFKRAIARIDIELPKGQLSHVLRHTFATHYLQNGGRLENLQEILDHEDIKTTMRYVHLNPQWADSVLALNPLTHRNNKDDKNHLPAACPHCGHISQTNTDKPEHTTTGTPSA